MANGKAWFGRTLGRFLFEHTKVVAVTPIGARFVKLVLEGPTLAAANFAPGDKVQVFVGDDGMRTYTPFEYDAAASRIALLVYVRDESPGSRFGRDAKVGDAVSFFGPRGSLALDAITGPALLVGDETSFALARSFETRHPEARTILEVDSAEESVEVARALGLERVEFVVRDGAHLDRIATKLASALRVAPYTSIVWSGRAKSIQALRRKLDVLAVSPRKHLSKAYWAEGRVGLD